MTNTPQSARPNADEIAKLMSALDLDTKVRLLTGASMFTLMPEPSIGLGELRFSDGPTGVRGLKFNGGRVVALFPNATLLASAWSTETAYEVGELLAEEALAQQIHVVLGPTINLHRSPLGGRLFEASSEDPFLTGVLAAAYVNGMQRHRVGSCLKHLVANESETLRDTMNSVVDEATLREVYLLPFEIATQESDPWTMMAAYNKVNGFAATEHDHVINEVVKGEWEYSGLVMSDWFATRTAAASANGGLDLVMPGPAGPWGQALVDAVTAGDVEEVVIDDHLRRLLVLADRVGVLGRERDYPSGVPAPDSAVRREQLTRLAAAGMTVLTNRGAVLPIERAQTVALIGRHAIETATMGGGAASVNAPYHVSIGEGLTAVLGDQVTVTDGVDVRTRPIAALPRFVADPATGEAGIHFTLLDAEGTVLDERHSRNATTLVGFDDDIDGIVATVRIRARLLEGGRLRLGVIGAGRWAVTAAGRTVDFTVALAGTGLGEEIVNPPRASDEFDVVAGDIVEATLTVDPTASSTGAEGHLGTIGLIATQAPRDAAAALREATEAAARADVAVVVVGLTDEQETESVDKSTLRLPGEQDALVAAVAAVARRTVVVVNAATPVLMPWLDTVDAVLWVGLPGQEGGHAVAAALLGIIEPSGRLVTTFPVADGATPAWSVTPADGDLPYEEGAFIGYRGHHAQRAPTPAFWFGHGLGYSTWDYSEGRADVTDQQVSVSVTVTNTGQRTSREVVQAYLEPAAADQPVRLVGWGAVQVAPGESSVVHVACDRRMWRRWDAVLASWDWLPDHGRLLVARGLGDVRATFDLRRGDLV